MKIAFGHLCLSVFVNAKICQALTKYFVRKMLKFKIDKYTAWVI